jgi:hypothetical protein
MGGCRGAFGRYATLRSWYCFDIGRVLLNNFLSIRGYRYSIPNIISVQLSAR